MSIVFPHKQTSLVKLQEIMQNHFIGENGKNYDAYEVEQMIQIKQNKIADASNKQLLKDQDDYAKHLLEQEQNSKPLPLTPDQETALIKKGRIELLGPSEAKELCRVNPLLQVAVKIQGVFGDRKAPVICTLKKALSKDLLFDGEFISQLWPTVQEGN